MTRVCITLAIAAAIMRTGAAHARPHPNLPDEDLLKVVPATVAVSSTVANAKILPSHLVDGDLSTAWNSRTGDLVGAWIKIRLPLGGVSVNAIAMTAGFTKGAYFEQNPRIKKVRIKWEDGDFVAALDPSDRGLQRIALPEPGGTGGEILIEVVEIEPGTKPEWREIAVSELQVRGQLVARPRPDKPLTPPVYVGTLDPEPIDHAACVKALFPAASHGAVGPHHGDEPIVRVESIALDAHTAVCRVDHQRPAADKVATELAVVDGGKVRGARIAATWSPATPDSVENDAKAGVELAAVAFGDDAGGLLVAVSSFAKSDEGPVLETHHALYRATAGLVQVLAFDSRRSGTSVPDDKVCHLVVLAAGAPLHDLDVWCAIRLRVDHDEWGNDAPTNAGSKDDTWFRWNGSGYEKHDAPHR